MTVAELHAAIARARANGHEYLQLTVARKRPPRYFDNAKLWRGGPRCRFVGETAPGRWLVDVTLAELEQALCRIEAASHGPS